MADSDDFIFDDEVLDETTLAALDEAANSYFSASTAPHHTTPPTPPPAKRQKIAHATHQARQPRRPLNVDDTKDLPDISIRHDGSYGVGVSQVSAVQTANQSTHYIDPQRARRNVISKPVHPIVPASTARNSSSPSSATSRPVPIIPPKEDPQEVLRQQFQELQNQYDQLQAQLLKATDARLMKEGEVSVLRKGMERTAQDHANELAKLRTAREEAEAKQRQLQRELKEEIESLKTQFTFKQQEYQSSLHSLKAPGSVRNKKTFNPPPSTPLVVGWDRAAGSSDRPFETPRRSRFLAVSQEESPKHARSRLAAKSPGLSRKSAMLPGFENAFMPSSPVKPIKLRPGGKGKHKAIVSQETDLFNQAISGPSSSPPVPDVNIAFGMDVDDPGPSSNKVDREAMDVATEAPVDTPLEELLDTVEPFDWDAELSRIISTHTTKLSNVLTLQLLVGVILPADMDVSKYHEACALIIRTLATKADQSPYQVTLQSVSATFVDMLPFLISAKLMLPLASLLDLLASLSFSIPAFPTVSLFQHTHSEASDPPPIVLHLKTIISTFLSPVIEVEHKAFLAIATIELLEALCWNLSEEVAPRLTSITSDPHAIPTLLHRSQPDFVLTQAIRLLVLLATHAPLSRSLLTAPDEINPKRVPLVERLATYLVDKRNGPEVDSSRRLIICLFGTLASNPESLNILTDSPTLIPAICAHISNLSSPIWEDDERYLANPGLVNGINDSLGHTLLLLHHLVFNSRPVVDLVAKLQQAPPKYFNGASHVFIVSFGRLSYAEPPSWMDKSASLTLEWVVDMARELLEHVVDGPEGDAIWQVYQGDVDEEDMEAQLLGPQASEG